MGCYCRADTGLVGSGWAGLVRRDVLCLHVKIWRPADVGGRPATVVAGSGWAGQVAACIELPEGLAHVVASPKARGGALVLLAPHPPSSCPERCRRVRSTCWRPMPVCHAGVEACACSRVPKRPGTHSTGKHSRAGVAQPESAGTHSRPDFLSGLPASTASQ